MIAGLSGNETKSIGFGIIMVLANIALMSILSFTPVAEFLFFLNDINGLLVILVYGALLTIGNSLAETGIKEMDTGLAWIGVGMLQFAYGTFGAGLLQNISLQGQLVVLGITAFITTLMAIIAGVIVYRSDKSFAKWQRYSMFSFIGVIASGVVGAFFTPFFVVSFALALFAFVALLVYEIWEMKAHHNNPLLNAIGLYVAYMGVFIHVLQLVLRLLSSLEE